MNIATPDPVRTDVRVPNAPIKKRPMEAVETSTTDTPNTIQSPVHMAPITTIPLHSPPIPKRIHF